MDLISPDKIRIRHDGEIAESNVVGQELADDIRIVLGADTLRAVVDGLPDVRGRVRGAEGGEVVWGQAVVVQVAALGVADGGDGAVGLDAVGLGVRGFGWGGGLAHDFFVHGGFDFGGGEGEDGWVSWGDGDAGWEGSCDHCWLGLWL